jgi:hypothetical protein
MKNLIMSNEQVLALESDFTKDVNRNKFIHVILARSLMMITKILMKVRLV